MGQHDLLEGSPDGSRHGGARLPLALLEVLGSVGTDAPDAQLQLVRLVDGGQRLRGQRPGHVRGEIDPGTGGGQDLAQCLDAVSVRLATAHGWAPSKAAIQGARSAGPSMAPSSLMPGRALR